MKNARCTVESQSLCAPRKSASRRNTLLQGEHYRDLSVIISTVNAIKEVSTMPFYKIISKIINILERVQIILTIVYIYILIPICINVEKS